MNHWNLELAIMIQHYIQVIDSEASHIYSFVLNYCSNFRGGNEHSAIKIKNYLYGLLLVSGRTQDVFSSFQMDIGHNLCPQESYSLKTDRVLEDEVQHKQKPHGGAQSLDLNTLVFYGQNANLLDHPIHSIMQTSRDTPLKEVDQCYKIPIQIVNLRCSIVQKMGHWNWTQEIWVLFLVLPLVCLAYLDCTQFGSRTVS